MKFFPTRLLLLLPLMIAGDLSVAAQVAAERSPIVHDTLLNREERRGFKQQREAWLQSMHRAAPDVDPQILNSAIRRSRLRAADDRKGRMTLADEAIMLTDRLRATWSERGSRNQAGRTWLATIDTVGSKIYVAADGGQIWRGGLEGEDWTPLNDDRRITGIRHLSVDYTQPTEPRLVVVAPGVAYRMSLDGRVVEEATGLENIVRWGGFSRVALTDGASPTIYAIGQEWDYDENWGSTGTLYRSTDMGRSFAMVERFPETWRLDIAAIPGTDSALVLIRDTLSRIGPESKIVDPFVIEKIDGGFGGIGQADLRIGHDRTLFLMVRRGGAGEMHASIDGGESWVQTASGLPGLFSRSAFAVDATDPNGFLMIGGVNLLSSGDAGITWDTTNKWGEYYGDPLNKLHADIPFVGFVPTGNGGRTLFVSTDGGLYRSEDRLASVRNIAIAGLGNGQYYSVYTSRVDTNRIFAGAQDQGFQRSEIPGDEGGDLLDFDQTISGDYGHITSGDGGRSIWTNYPGFAMYYPTASEAEIGRQRSREFITEGHLWIPPIVAEPDSPRVALVAGGGTNDAPGARLIRTEYVGGRVQMTAGDFDFSEGQSGISLTGIGISPINPDYRWVITSDERLWRSVDRGKQWQSVGPALSGHHFYGTVILPSKSNLSTLWVAGSGYSNPGVWVSHDGGRSFDSIAAGLPSTLVYDLDVSTDNRLLFAATATGPYVWIADSSRWYDLTTAGAPDQTWWSVDYVEEIGVVRFGTFGRGIWDLRLEEVEPTGVDAPALSSPPHLALAASTSSQGLVLRLQSERTGRAEVLLYDLEGRIVATLHDGRVAEGLTEIRPDALPASLPTGSYFCVASLDGSVAYARIEVR